MQHELNVVSTHGQLGVSVEHIIHHQIEELVTLYDERMFQCIVNQNYEQCEKHLTDFCLKLLDLTDHEQVFIARTFFVGIVTEIIRIKKRKNTLHPQILSHAYALIDTIEQWENLSEYILATSAYMDSLINNIIARPAMFEKSLYLEKALQIINENLTNHRLSVSWLAEQLDVSTTHLSQLFKLRIGQTISKYILERKLDEIKYELTYTNKSLTEIRVTYGFINHSHFIQQFKKSIGMTPLQFQKSLFK